MSPVSVRYIVDDVDAAIPFYTEMLGFTLDLIRRRASRGCPEAISTCCSTGPGRAAPGQSMSDGQAPAPGGGTRIQIGVADLESTVETLKAAGSRFRNEIVVGNGGKQILVEDPSGNPIELFEPGRRSSARSAASRRPAAPRTARTAPPCAGTPGS